MDKLQFGLGICAIVGCLQGIAWSFGYDGKVFAFTSFVIGGITGSVFGLSLNKKKD